MIWYSPSSPTLCSTFSWRTDLLTSYGRGLRGLSLATVATISAALALVFFYAPLDADQGFIQKIFYIHVPLAIVSLCGFIFGGVLAVGHLRTGDRRWDMRSYVAIHMALIFGVGALITGSIWAKASWGHWWVWNEPTLVSFLIVVLLFATYQPLRFAIEDPVLQARYASVFAITAGAFVPMNFIAVRLATAYVHPRVLGSTSNLPPRMALTFGVSLAGFSLLYLTLCAYELAVKRARARLSALRRRAEQRAGTPEAATAPRRPRSAVPSLTGAETLATEAGRGGA